jgi:hypothetical protein
MGRGKAAKTKEIITTAVAILRASKFALTVRRLFYELVTRAIIANHEKVYKGMITKLNDARWDGDLPVELFDKIVDGSREPLSVVTWNSIEDYAPVAARIFRRDRWQDQSAYVELWVEKQAVVSLLEGICREYHVTLRPLHGFNSFTAIHQTAKDLIPITKNIVIFYLGDLDPHGLEIERDARDRLFRMFNLLGRPGKKHLIDFRPRLGILKEDITNKEFGIYPLDVVEMEKGGANYAAKREAFVAEYGNAAAEVDGLPTEEMIRRVQEAFESCIDDRDGWDNAESETEGDRIIIRHRLTRRPGQKVTL